MARERRTIRYDDDVWALLEAYSSTTSKPVTAIVNDAIRYYLSEDQPSLEVRLRTLESRLSATESRLTMLENKLDPTD